MFKLVIFVLFVFSNVYSSCATDVKSEIKILVVGAGASGLSASKYLYENGYTNIKIFEAEPRIGGRIHTKEWDNGFIELGAEWIYGSEGNIVYELSKDYSLLGPSIVLKHGMSFHFSNGQNLTEDFEQKMNEKLFKEMLATDDFDTCTDTLNECFSQKYAEIISEHFPEISDSNKLMFHQILENYMAVMTQVDDLTNENGLGYMKCKDIGDGNFSGWMNSSFNTFIDILMNKYPNASAAYPFDIKLNTKVTKINWFGEDVIVHTENGESHHFNKIIVTLPLGVLKSNYKTLFEPSLPQSKIDAIENLNVAVLNKVFLKFEERWWPEDFSASAIAWLPEDYAELTGDREWIRGVVGFAPVDNHPTTVSVIIYGKYAKQFEHVNDNDVKAEVTNIIQKFFGTSFPNLSGPTSLIRTKWYSEPNFQGSYSYLGISAYNANITNENLYTPLKNENGITTMFFAGEATHSKYFSTVHGAVESGKRASHDLMQ